MKKFWMVWSDSAINKVRTYQSEKEALDVAEKDAIELGVDFYVLKAIGKVERKMQYTKME